MKLIAKKPCGFGGKKFYIGDEIPVEYVQNPKAQEKLGTLAIVNDEADTPAVEAMEVVIHAEEGDLQLKLTKEGLQAFVDVLTSTVPDAKPIIEQMTDGDALILLHVSDDRKDIKKAAEARAKALSPQEPEESAGEQ